MLMHVILLDNRVVMVHSDAVQDESLEKRLVRSAPSGDSGSPLVSVRLYWDEQSCPDYWRAPPVSERESLCYGVFLNKLPICFFVIKFRLGTGRGPRSAAR